MLFGLVAWRTDTLLNRLAVPVGLVAAPNTRLRISFSASAATCLAPAVRRSSCQSFAFSVSDCAGARFNSRHMRLTRQSVQDIVTMIEQSPDRDPRQSGRRQARCRSKLVQRLAVFSR